MVNVVCLKWGAKYGPEYVNRLFYAVERNTTVPFTFYCFTDDPKGLDEEIKHKPLKYTNINSWWNKLYLFSQETELEGRVFFLDLDTLITGNIDHMLTCNHEFVVLHDVMWKVNPQLTPHDVGSAVMLWTAGNHSQIWESFKKDPHGISKKLHPHGDQKWIQQQEPNRAYWQDLFPGEIISFKVDCEDKLPSAAKIICFHGRPSIPEAITQTTKWGKKTILPQKWITEVWTDK